MDPQTVHQYETKSHSIQGDHWDAASIIWSMTNAWNWYVKLQFLKCVKWRIWCPNCLHLPPPRLALYHQCAERQMRTLDRCASWNDYLATHSEFYPGNLIFCICSLRERFDTTRINWNFEISCHQQITPTWQRTGSDPKGQRSTWQQPPLWLEQ